MNNKKAFDIKSIVAMGLMVAIITVCSWISISVFSIIPFTLQTFAVLVTAGLLAAKKGTLTVLAYIILGGIGVPVFSGFKAGIGVLTGPTGGYILGFLLMVPVIGLILNKFGKRILVLIIAFVLGIIICYTFGTAWFIYIYSATKEPVSIASALSMCVVPYIIPDIFKIALSVLIVKKVSPRIKF